MIYILGMSHAINVLKAASRVPLTFTHENWSEMASASQFFDIEAKPGLIVGDTLKAFLVHPSLGWEYGEIEYFTGWATASNCSRWIHRPITLN